MYFISYKMSFAGFRSPILKDGLPKRAIYVRRKLNPNRTAQ
ncbi:MAG: hypothetical protein BWY82_01246 [Verrucomicrobia bacterium ADurb.Bin474]|nr:MAG: hypothetical protein BWY82_01246 [Verrucomicrobia bacterium ADurb.Bin474]